MFTQIDHVIWARFFLFMWSLLASTNILQHYIYMKLHKKSKFQDGIVLLCIMAKNENYNGRMASIDVHNMFKQGIDEVILFAKLQWLFFLHWPQKHRISWTYCFTILNIVALVEIVDTPSCRECQRVKETYITIHDIQERSLVNSSGYVLGKEDFLNMRC